MNHVNAKMAAATLDSFLRVNFVRACIEGAKRYARNRHVIACHVDSSSNLIFIKTKVRGLWF